MTENAFPEILLEICCQSKNVWLTNMNFCGCQNHCTLLPYTLLQPSQASTVAICHIQPVVYCISNTASAVWEWFLCGSENMTWPLCGILTASAIMIISPLTDRQRHNCNHIIIRPTSSSLTPLPLLPTPTCVLNTYASLTVHTQLMVHGLREFTHVCERHSSVISA
jgi:hypothetical protein